MKKYSFVQKFLIAFNGKIKVGERTHEGWKDPIMFYAFNCPIHGIVEDNPHGNGRLICPKCIENTHEQ